MSSAAFLRRFAMASGLAAAACASPPDGPPGASNGGAANGAGGSGGTAPRCAEGPDYTDEPALREAGSISANLIRLDGAPAASVECQLCGIDVCLSIVRSDESGRVTMQGGAPLDTPAFKVGDGLDYVKIALELAGGAIEHRFDDLLAAELTDTLQPFEGGGTVSGQGVTLRFEPDGVARVDTLSFPEPSQQTFRVVELPAERIAEIAPASQGLEALFGLGPVETALCPPAELSVPNAPGWPAGTEVDFVLHGTNVSEKWAPYAGWARVSGGAVSDDGAVITTHAGEGLPVLGLLGVRRVD
jgi:hypothetical protein